MNAYDKVYQCVVNNLSIFDLHASRLQCLSEFVLCMIKLRTVNLKQLSRVFYSSTASADSSERRLRRFISQISFDMRALSLWVADIMDLWSSPCWKLCIDRTNWRLGTYHISLLYLSVYIPDQSISVPIVWMFVRGKKQGNCSYQQKSGLLNSFIQWYGKGRIEK